MSPGLQANAVVLSARFPQLKLAGHILGGGNEGCLINYMYCDDGTALLLYSPI